MHIIMYIAVVVQRASVQCFNQVSVQICRSLWNAMLSAFYLWHDEINTWPRCPTVTHYFLPTRNSQVQFLERAHASTHSGLCRCVCVIFESLFSLLYSVLPLLSINNNCRVIVNVRICEIQMEKKIASHVAWQRSWAFRDSNAKRTQHLGNKWTHYIVARCCESILRSMKK